MNNKPELAIIPFSFELYDRHYLGRAVGGTFPANMQFEVFTGWQAFTLLAQQQQRGYTWTTNQEHVPVAAVAIIGRIIEAYFGIP